MEEGLISRGGTNLRLPLRFGLRPSELRVPAELGQESQASSCLRKGTPLASRVAQGVSGPFSSCVWILRIFRTMHAGVGAPSCCAFTHRFAFEEVSGHLVLIKSGPGNRGRLACGITHVASLEFPRLTGVILRCAGKAGNPFQTKQGNRLSCPYQEERRGSDEVVPGHSVFPLREPGVSGNFWGRIKCAKYRFARQDGTWDFS